MVANIRSEHRPAGVVGGSNIETPAFPLPWPGNFNNKRMATTVKVRLRPSTMKDKAGTVCYRITHRRSVRQIATDIRLLPEDWDPENERIAPAVTGRSQNRGRRRSPAAYRQAIG